MMITKKGRHTGPFLLNNLFKTTNRPSLKANQSDDVAVSLKFQCLCIKVQVLYCIVAVGENQETLVDLHTWKVVRYMVDQSSKF